MIAVILLGFAWLIALGVGCYVGGQTLAALVGRALDIADRRVALGEIKARSSSSPIIPSDLVRRITRWQDPGAQDSERTAILNLYEECRDDKDPWAAVRSHLPPEPRDVIDSPLLS